MTEPNHIAGIEKGRRTMKLQPQSPESLTRDHWDVPIRVGLASYVEFSKSIDQQLEGLVLGWQHKAAPAAMKGEQHRTKNSGDV
jgi:hypothetical protein